MLAQAVVKHLTQLLTSQVQSTGWEVTLERQKLRAEALANEFGALVEYAARKLLGMFSSAAYLRQLSAVCHILLLCEAQHCFVFMALRSCCYSIHCSVLSSDGTFGTVCTYATALHHTPHDIEQH